MGRTPKKARASDRDRTDASLRSERRNLDEARRDVRHADADVAAVSDRAVAGGDQATRQETRNDMDEARQGQQNAIQALDGLLVHERAATDAYLLTERGRSDDAVSNRDDFLGMVAHDVRNLLSLVVLSTEMLRSHRGELNAQLVESAADRIRRYAARMNGLVGDLVDITSIEAGKLRMRPVEGDAASLVRDATDTFGPAAVEKGLALEAAVPAGAIPAVFDYDRLLQVMSNLLSNAIKFTPHGGKITVTVEGRAKTVGFCVEDNGPGVPPMMREAIFERFWKATENDRRGQGLGLYISRSIVEAHHGRIWAESGVNDGTRMCFEIPLSRPRRSPRTA